METKRSRRSNQLVETQIFCQLSLYYQIIQKLCFVIPNCTCMINPRFIAKDIIALTKYPSYHENITNNLMKGLIF